MNEDFLTRKLSERRKANSLRSLVTQKGKVDFCSNDYLGVVKNKLLSNIDDSAFSHGSTGSRLLSGNYQMAEDTEGFIAGFHEADAGLIFNSGYDANLGLIAAVAQKGDLVIYDQLSHASIRDGVRLSFASAHSFQHNDVADLEGKLMNAHEAQNIFVITESVFSMDGDMTPLEKIAGLCRKYSAHLIVDEAHATGVIGERGEGLVQKLRLQGQCFARIHTFGKACGVHGAIVLGSEELKKYLINFARPFIYSTALPPSGMNSIAASYKVFPALVEERRKLYELVDIFRNYPLKRTLIKSDTPIQGVLVPGNDEVKKVASNLQQANFDVRPILYPTVPDGKERLRIVLHAFNTREEVTQLLYLMNR